MGSALRPAKLNWAPQPGPQAEFVASEVFDVVYGGARGGGKTDGVLGEFSFHAALHGEAARGLLVRRTRSALEPTIGRAREIFAVDGAKWRQGRSRFEWPDGAVLYFRHLDNDADADLYQGHDYSRLYVEELTQFPSPKPIDKLKACLRSAAGVRCAYRATCNPGGAGHGWVKARYIDNGPRRVISETVESPFGGQPLTLERMFIPARLSDNPRLIARDPLYVARLRQCGSAALVRAWLEGDWDAVEGAFFDGWSARNIVCAFIIPVHWTRIRAFDWGFAAPFSVGWWALASEDFAVDGRILPRGSLIRYREWYGADRRNGGGLRLEAERVAAGILEREAGEAITHGVADPSIFSQNGGPSIGERMARAGVAFRRADNTRVGAAGALSGWDQMRARIAGVDGAPSLYVFDTCRDFLRTVPALQHDRERAEDLDTAAEDHIADETRYACLSRPLIAASPRPARNPNDLGGWRCERPTESWKAL